ncbi:copper transport protein ctr1 [Actinomortierella ambigua]|nr:copper transport protein ctr1 [Actinomortierella ambigua]
MSSLVIRNNLGSGEYGHVYLASWKGRNVAVKKFFVVQDDVLQSAAIQSEIDILKTLADRHIIQFYGTTYHEGMLVLIMDYAEGGSLKNAIDGRRLTDWPTRNRVAQEIVRGLAYIHHEGVIHRDLKSMNVLFTRHMEVKLCDFGLATIKVRSTSSSTTLKGTIRWMAPELFALKPKYSTKSDMYALGVVMWEMATNCTMPFQHQPNNEMVIRFVEAGRREELPEDTPDNYRKWVERCWAHDPLERPEASEMAVDDDVQDHAGEVGAELSKLSITNDALSLSMMRSSNGSAGVARGITDKTPTDVDALFIRASGDDVGTLLQLAYMYENGIDVNQDDELAFEIYHRAAELHSVVAEVKTGDNFYYGRGTSKNHVASAYWRRQAAEKGHFEAQLRLGIMYKNGRGVAQDDVSAVLWLRKSAEQGYALAQYSLGLMYETGRGVAQDYAEALSWYRKSANQGYALAQNNLGLIYASGRGVAQDYAEALSWYRESAEQGDAVAQYNIGLMYNYRQGVAQDYAEALSWYRKSANQGYALAQNNLGLMYTSGQGVAKDYTEALSWYRKSAEQGDAVAQYNIGLMYEKGRGVAQDYAKALSWYRKSAEQGDETAQYNLGKMCEYGRGIDRDIQQATQWYRRAADQGHSEAKWELSKFVYVPGYSL